METVEDNCLNIIQDSQIPLSIFQIQERLENEETNQKVLNQILEKLVSKNLIHSKSFPCGSIFFKKDLISISPKTNQVSTSPSKSPKETGKSPNVTPQKRKRIGLSPLKPKSEQSQAPAKKIKGETLEQEHEKLIKLLEKRKKELNEIQRKFANKDNLKEKISKARGDRDGKLEPLTEKWISVCQEALEELKQKSTSENITIGRLVLHFNIDSKLIRFNEEEDSFY